MKAAVYHRYGPPDVVQIVDVPRPDPERNEVLVNAGDDSHRWRLAPAERSCAAGIWCRDAPWLRHLRPA